MFKVIFRSLFVIVMISSLVACGTPKKKQAPKPGPISQQATFIEASNENEVLIRATGQGASVADAMTDAKKVAVWFVLESGSVPLLSNDAAKSAFKAQQQAFWSNYNQYLRHVSDIKGKRQQGDNHLVDLVIRVDRAAIKSYLIEKQIIEDTASINAKLDLPTISVVSNSDVLTQIIAGGLQDSGFTVLALDAQQKQSKILQQMTALEGVADPEFNMALAAGADIVIKAQAEVTQQKVYGVETQKAAVFLNGYDSVTTQSLAATTGFSSERKAASAVVTQEAGNDAVLKLRSKLEKAWAKQMADGKIFKVVFLSDEPLTEANDIAFYEAMKSVKQLKVKRLRAGSQMVSYWLWSKDYQQGFDLFMDLKSAFHGQGNLSKNLENGRLLMIKLEAEGGMTLQ